MSLLPFCQWMADTPGSIALHESLYLYPLVESTHVLTLCLFLGMAIMFDLRLLGLTQTRVPITEFKRRLGPWMVAGFVVMVLTGLLLFYAIPIRSYQSLWFRIKVVALVLAGLNAWVFHTTIDRKVVAGRMIAYNWFDCDKQPQTKVVNVLAGCVVPSEGSRR